MRYIRFLKAPKIQDGHIKALVTITSDLGETFFPQDVSLSASVRSADDHGEIYLRRALKWTAGMRSLPISFRIEGNDIDWPARIHVSLKNSPLSDHFEKHHNDSDLPNIVSAWSDVLDPDKGLTETSKSVQRRFTPLSNRLLSIWEETGESIARHIWDAGLALSAYLDRMIALQAEGLPLVEESLGSATFKKLNIIELGSGCGIVGITLAQVVPDCKVLLTDLPEAQAIAERNISCMNPAMGSAATFEQLDWEQPLPKSVQAKTFDLILVADCTYNPDSGPALVSTLSSLALKSPKSVVLLSMKVRHESEFAFFDLMKKAHFIQRVRVKIPLPELGDFEEPEHVFVYVFYHKDRPMYGEKSQSGERQPIVQFWAE